MAFSFQAIRYGWVALASLGVITGTTIYVANNQRHQVKPQDVIELALGTDERAMATQTGTNSDGTPIYAVARPSFVRTWTSNVYTTNGVTVYTNIVTNAIGWHIDRDMMVSLDTTIKALVPYYVDTNTVYDGTTNIVMLTVTGLWASLGIGDHTNQFTRTPCWTNPVSTNWIVNYTSYWPSTNGTATNICYTSDYRQVVNYAQSWTVTGGYIWVTSSNWASEVVTVTNAATYGDYPWQIYVEDLQERYKVLNALKMTKRNIYAQGLAVRWCYGEVKTNWSLAKSSSESYYTNSIQPIDGLLSYVLHDGIIGAGIYDMEGPGPEYAGVLNATWITNMEYMRGFNNTELLYTATCKYICEPIFHFDGAWFTSSSFLMDFDGYGIFQDNGWQTLAASVPFGVNPYSGYPTWSSDPTGLTNVIIQGGVVGGATARGFSLQDAATFVDWQFNYCTNKYW